MPIYEYQCTNCGQHCEKLQKVTAGKTLSCPKCQTDTMTRIVSKTHFKLQGTGWYETDFKDQKPKSSPQTSGDNNTKEKSSATSNKKQTTEKKKE
jgi:putative FmdB family regulatory protein